MSRRAFVKKGLSACSIAFLAADAIGNEPGIEADTAGETLPDIVSVKGETGDAVRKAVEGLGGISRFVKPGCKVFLKPNLGFANPPEWATTTNPDVVRAIAEIVIDAGAKTVLVGDNPNLKPDLVIERCGIKKALDGLDGVRVFIINRPRDFREVPVPGGSELETLSVASILSKVDLVINIPIAKAHSGTSVSFGLKNLMGVIENREPFHTRYDLHKAIVDLNRVIAPDLTILDATNILTTGGPSGPGKTVRKNIVAAGTDRVAMDAYGLTLDRFNGRNLKPQQVPHILAAHEAGLGEMDLKKLTILTETV